jgi:predicted nucleic acid-binding protein
MDSSLAMAWCFPDETTPATSGLLDRMDTEAAAVPAWWFLEVANVLALAERKGRVTPGQVAGFIAMIERFELDIDNQAPERAFTHILPLCRTHRLTSYDAAYLELALRRHLPLASLDDDLRDAARSLGVKLLGK